MGGANAVGVENTSAFTPANNNPTLPAESSQAILQPPQLAAPAARAVVLGRGSGDRPRRAAAARGEEAEVVLGELREGGRVAAHGALEDESLLVLQPGGAQVVSRQVERCHALRQGALASYFLLPTSLLPTCSRRMPCYIVTYFHTTHLQPEDALLHSVAYHEAHL
eukprot:scaffold15075_cov60-Phaeocystis_antarctica.AAC.8